jgi:hypothetical protein
MPGFGLTLWVLAVYGLTFLLSDAKILSEWIPIRPLLQRARFLRELLECYFCMGLWVGGGLWVAVQWPNPWTIQALLYLPAGATGAYLLDLAVHYAETRILTAPFRARPSEED